MEFNPIAIVVVILGALAVIIGIRGSQGAIFQTLTGHTPGPLTSASGPGLGTANNTFNAGNPAPPLAGESQSAANALGNAIVGNTQAVRG